MSRFRSAIAGAGLQARAGGKQTQQAVSPLVLQQTGFVRQKQLLNFVPYSKTTLWRRVKTGDFPAPIRLSAGITAWRAEDVHQWFARVSGAAAGSAGDAAVRT